MADGLPTGFRSDFVHVNGLRFHVVHNGNPLGDGPLVDGRHPILMLHGFPEFWIAWEAVLKPLGQDYLFLVPDQRGYNLTDAPPGVENYQVNLLVKDMLQLVERMIGERPHAVAGHDWGASIAYALAMHKPDQVTHLVVANGVHPASFQQALIDDPAQAEASAYFHILRGKDAGALMTQGEFRRTFGMFERFSLTPWLTDELRSQYRKAWSDQERMQAMLNWYNSSPILVPEPGKQISDAPLYNVSADKLRIAMPHLLIWGMKDQALLPTSRARLPEFCDQLKTVEIADADHWLLHTHGERIAREIREFVPAD